MPSTRTASVPVVEIVSVEHGSDSSMGGKLPGGMLRQRLLWPPAAVGKKADGASPPPADSNHSRVDIVQATRLTNRPLPLPQKSGLEYVETGIRFDPQEFPEISRKTQEKLASKIIEAGRTPQHGRTIKVKEYSSKSRKRIRFACSRDDCGVTFQINFDSSKGHWYMKRNKGCFDHTCSALRAASNKSPQTTQYCSPVVESLQPPPAQVTPVPNQTKSSTTATTSTKKTLSSKISQGTRGKKSTPTLRRANTGGSTKRSSPELSPVPEKPIKRSRRTRAASASKVPPRRASSVLESSSARPGPTLALRPMVRSTSLPYDPYDPYHSHHLYHHYAPPPMHVSSGHMVRPIATSPIEFSKLPAVEFSRRPAASSSNGSTSEDRSGREKRSSSRAAKNRRTMQEERLPAAVEIQPRTKTSVRGSSVAVSIYSDDTRLMKEESDPYHHYHHLPKSTDAGAPVPYPNDMFSSTPPTPPRKVVCTSDFSDKMFVTPLTDDLGHDFPTLPRTSSCLSQHAALMEGEMLHDFDATEAAEENMEDLDANAAPSLCTLESAKRALLGDSTGTSENVDEEAADAEGKGGPKVEHLSHDFSMCSLIVNPLDLVNVNPLDLVNVGNWVKDAKEPDVGSRNSERADDNSSISTNWSLLADDLKC